MTTRRNILHDRQTMAGLSFFRCSNGVYRNRHATSPGVTRLFLLFREN